MCEWPKGQNPTSDAFLRRRVNQASGFPCPCSKPTLPCTAGCQRGSSAVWGLASRGHGRATLEASASPAPRGLRGTLAAHPYDSLSDGPAASQQLLCYPESLSQGCPAWNRIPKPPLPEIGCSPRRTTARLFSISFPDLCS